MQEMDFTDRELKACKCGYEICVWCWHHIMGMAEKEDCLGRCPACHAEYDKESKLSMTIMIESHVDGKHEKMQKSGKAQSGWSSKEKEDLRHLRILQRNVVHILGIPINLANEQTLGRKDFLGQYGKILRIDIPETPGYTTTRSVFAHFSNVDEAVRCILVVNGYTLVGRTLKASFAAIRYCDKYLKNLCCRNSECTFLHKAASTEDICWKEEVLAVASSDLQNYSRNASYERAWHCGDCLPPIRRNSYSDSSVAASKLPVQQTYLGQRFHDNCISPNGGEKSKCFTAEDSLTLESSRPTYASIAGSSRPSGQKGHSERICPTVGGEKTSNLISCRPTYASIAGSSRPSGCHPRTSGFTSPSSSAGDPPIPALTCVKHREPSVSADGWVDREILGTSLLQQTQLEQVQRL